MLTSVPPCVPPRQGATVARRRAGGGRGGGRVPRLEAGESEPGRGGSTQDFARPVE